MSTKTTKRAKPQPTFMIGGKPINVNWSGLVTTVIGAAILFAVQRQCSQSDETKKASQQTQTEVSEGRVQLQTVGKNVDDVKGEVKEVRKTVEDAKASMVTRTEVDAKHQTLKDAIHDAKTDLSTRQDRLETTIMNRSAREPDK